MPAPPKSLWLEWTVILLTRLMMTVTRLMPLAWARALGRIVGAGLYASNQRMRRVAMRNLELAYPEWSPDRRRLVARCIPSNSQLPKWGPKTITPCPEASGSVTQATPSTSSSASVCVQG